jgi:membrane protease YdiL (CAAX protease family)
MALAAVLYTILGAVQWDFTGQSFLVSLEKQFAAAGQNMYTSLPQGFTPQTMLIFYVIGALTVFNIPGIITGFGEEFGHRGLMFPLLYQIRPWVGIVIGGLLWYAWHLPLLLLIPPSVSIPIWQTLLLQVISAIGYILTFIYLAYVLIKTESIFATSLAHITMNNAGTAMSFFLTIQNTLLANLGLTLAMAAVILLLYARGETKIFTIHFSRQENVLAREKKSHLNSESPAASR